MDILQCVCTVQHCADLKCACIVYHHTHLQIGVHELWLVPECCVIKFTCVGFYYKFKRA